MNKKQVTKILCFFILFAILFMSIYDVFLREDRRSYYTVCEFYNERNNSLDAVYIGSSLVYAYWQSVFAYEEYGITVLPFSTQRMPRKAYKYIVQEARKTQPDAVYIITLDGFKSTEVSMEFLHAITDKMPLSLNKIQMVKCLTGDAHENLISKMEYFFRIIRFHSRWTELGKEDFYNKNPKYKGGQTYKLFLEVSKNVSDTYVYTEETKDMAEENKDVLEDFLDYCEEETLNVLFVNVPRANEHINEIKELNMAAEIVREHGYDVVNLMNRIEDIGLDLHYDYYNNRHTNVHGSIKFTHYLGKILVDKYCFSDKRDESAYTSWGEAHELYSEQLLPYTLDFEREFSERDYSMLSPDISVVAQDDSLYVSWTLTEGADAYAIYRKAGQSGIWERTGTAGVGSQIYEDRLVETEKEYTYTVVPLRYDGDDEVYGNFNVIGVNGSL